MTLRRIVQLPAEQAGAALRPKFVQGKWKRPMLSGRKAMQLKQKAKENDLLGNWIVGQGGWLPQWDKPNKHRVMRPPKGTKHERNELQRFVICVRYVMRLIFYVCVAV